MRYVRSLTGPHSKEYKLWLNMKDRCNRASIHARQPAYAGCTIAPEFQDFESFASWCHTQPGFSLPDAQLDKDILGRGNKAYGPATCVFVPRRINQALVKRDASRGLLPVGVSLVPGRTDKYVAQCNRGNLPRRLGVFDSVSSAFAAYKQAKESYLKALADEFEGRIDSRATAALRAYRVEITD